jgi:hypothetical protein
MRTARDTRQLGSSRRRILPSILERGLFRAIGFVLTRGWELEGQDQDSRVGLSE